MKQRILSLLLLLLLTSCNKEDSVTIGYQQMANPWKYLIATGQLKELEGKKIDLKKFNSGAKVINAMASGDIDIAVAGSTPIAAGMSQGLDIKLLWVMEIIGDAEALVVKKEINSINDLKGKKVGVPFGSTTHFHLLVALKEAGMSAKDLTILNLSPSSIVASWKKGDIDAAFVWAPALEDIKQSGKVLLSSKQLAKTAPTFDGIIARNSFLKNNKKFAISFLNKIIENHKGYNQNPWKQEDEKVKKIAAFVGSSEENVTKNLQGYIFPLKADHPTSKIASILKTTADFLKEQGKIESTLKDYTPSVALKIISEL